MNDCLNFSALPTNAAATFMRFELADINGFESRVPVRYVKEWVYPRGNAGNASNELQFKTVRISEHKWPLHKTTTTCHADYVREDMWPSPKRAPLTRPDLINLCLLCPSEHYRGSWAAEPSLALDGKAWMEHVTHSLHGNPASNDGLPEDYLEFWQQERGEENSNEN